MCFCPLSAWLSTVQPFCSNDSLRGPLSFGPSLDGDPRSMLSPTPPTSTATTIAPSRTFRRERSRSGSESVTRPMTYHSRERNGRRSRLCGRRLKLTGGRDGGEPTTSCSWESYPDGGTRKRRSCGLPSDFLENPAEASRGRDSVPKGGMFVPL